MLNGEAVSETASSFSTKTTSAFTNTPAPQDASTFTSPASSSSSSSSAHPSDKTGVIVGGVIGAVSVLALLSGIIAWIWMRHHRQNPENHHIPQTVWIGQTHSKEHVVPTDNRLHEVDALRPRAELADR